MPKLDPKEIQKELSLNLVWPVYWIFGTESMKVRELLKRIQNHLFPTGSRTLNEEILDGQTVNATEVVDASKSLALNGGVRLTIVKNASALKGLETIESIFGKRTQNNETQSVTIFISKEFDRRKKIFKKILKETAVISCEPVIDREREAWINYLAKRKKISLSQPSLLLLRSIEPWSLDIVDQELSKYELAQSENDATSVLQGGSGQQKVSENFLESFFSRNYLKAISCTKTISNAPEIAIPLIGLLTWNSKQLLAYLTNKNTQFNPYLRNRIQNWSPHWTLQDLIKLQSSLAEVDFGTKQTPKLPLGLWNQLVTQFCQKNSS